MKMKLSLILVILNSGNRKVHCESSHIDIYNNVRSLQRARTLEARYRKQNQQNFFYQNVPGYHDTLLLTQKLSRKLK